MGIFPKLITHIAIVSIATTATAQNFQPASAAPFAAIAGNALITDQNQKSQTPAGDGGWFKKDVARDFGSAETQISEKPVLRILAEPRKDDEAITPEAGAAAKEGEVAAPQSLVEKFGDPDKEAPILAIDTAPVPFKGMMAALDSGEEDLAFRYARQYVRHLRNLRERTTEVMSLTGLAMEREGMSEGATKDGFPELYEHRKLLADDLARDKQLKTEESRVASLDSSTKEMLARAEASEPEVKREKAAPLRHTKIASAASARETSSNVDAKSGSMLNAVKEDVSRGAQSRSEARAVLQSRVPVDPQGKVDIYFFFRPEDKASIAMAPVIEAVYQRSKTDKRINIIGMTFESNSPFDIKKFHVETRTTFPVKNGRALIKGLGLTTAPSMSFIAQTTGKVFSQDGIKSKDYVDEIVTMMQGR